MTTDLHISTPFKWTSVRARAAVLAAADELSDEAIATELGIVRRTLATWKQHPEFQQRVAEHVRELEAAVASLAIAKRRERVKILDDQQSRMLRVQEARAGLYKDIPGGDTGLIVKQVKIGSAGDEIIVIDEYVVDTGLMSELRANQKQAAQELGQWSEKATVDHTGGIRREYVLVTDAGTGDLDVTDEAAFAEQAAALAMLENDTATDEDAP